MIKQDGLWLLNGDCLERMKEIPDGSVDLILTDPPYDIKNTKAGGNSPLAKSMQKMNDQIRDANIVSGFNIVITSYSIHYTKLYEATDWK